MTKQGSKGAKIIGWGGLLAALLIAAAVFLNRQWIVDWWWGRQYEPSAEMVAIQEKLQLTGKGKFLFAALRPTLNEAEEFNANCHQEASETAVLGCYTDGQVRIYNIKTAELDGIREVTAAHEFLHAVWERMGTKERHEIAEMLEEISEREQGNLAQELEIYAADLRQEETYVRAGTEVAELPAGLEEHFAKYFSNREAIVRYYEGYIGVFNEQKARAEKLKEELPGLKEQIDRQAQEYQAAAESLETEIQEFNDCAVAAGCFETQAEFAAQRSKLTAEQDELQSQSEKINQLIADYNAKVAEYNQIVDDSRKLEQEINSNSLTEQ